MDRDLLLVWRFLQRRWWLIALPTLIASVVAVPQLLRNEQIAAGGFQTSFRYSAAQEQSNLDERIGDYQDVWLASEFVVNAFTDWVRSSTFRDELAQQLGDRAVLANLDIAADNNRSIGEVIMSHPDADTLEDIAAASIAVLQTRNQVYFPHLGDAPAAVTLIHAPQITAVPPTLANRFEPLLQIGLALLGGMILAFAVEYFDATIRYPDEVEAEGLPVLATIPRQR